MFHFHWHFFMLFSQLVLIIFERLNVKSYWILEFMNSYVCTVKFFYKVYINCFHTCQQTSKKEASTAVSLNLYEKFFKEFLCNDDSGNIHMVLKNLHGDECRKGYSRSGWVVSHLLVPCQTKLPRKWSLGCSFNDLDKKTWFAWLTENFEEKSISVFLCIWISTGLLHSKLMLVMAEFQTHNESDTRSCNYCFSFSSITWIQWTDGSTCKVTAP